MNSLPTGKFFTPADFFQNQDFQKILSGILSVSNSLDPDPDILSGLIWIQAVYKSQQQTKLVTKGKELTAFF